MQLLFNQIETMYSYQHLEGLWARLHWRSDVLLCFLLDLRPKVGPLLDYVVRVGVKILQLI
jgi:hypothetical protein